MIDTGKILALLQEQQMRIDSCLRLVTQAEAILKEIQNELVQQS